MNLVTNTLWILGFAVAMATLSYASWRASLKGINMRTILMDHQYQIVLNLSSVLFCLGLAATSDANWEIFIYMLLAATFAAQLVKTILENRKKALTRPGIKSI